MRPAAPEVGGGVDEDMIGTGCRSGDRNKVGGDRAILDRGYGYLRRGDRYTLDRWLGPQGGGGVTPPPIDVHLLNGLNAYWPLEGGGGTSFAVDVSGNGNTLSGYGPPTLGPGKIGNAYFFPGSDNLNAASNPFFTFPGNSSFTFQCWVNMTSAPAVGTYGAIMSKWSDSAGQAEYGFMVYHDSTLGTYLTLVIYTADGQYVGAPSDPTLVVPVGTWVHCLGWYDSSTGKVSVRLNHGTIFTSTAVTLVGCNVGASQFNGASSQVSSQGYWFLDGGLDEMAIWKRVLNSDEQDALWNGGAGLPYSSFGTLLQRVQQRLKPRVGQPLPK